MLSILIFTIFLVVPLLLLAVLIYLLVCIPGAVLLMLLLGFIASITATPVLAIGFWPCLLIAAVVGIIL